MFMCDNQLEYGIKKCADYSSLAFGIVPSFFVGVYLFKGESSTGAIAGFLFSMVIGYMLSPQLESWCSITYASDVANDPMLDYLRKKKNISVNLIQQDEENILYCTADNEFIYSREVCLIGEEWFETIEEIY